MILIHKSKDHFNVMARLAPISLNWRHFHYIRFWKSINPNMMAVFKCSRQCTWAGTGKATWVLSNLNNPPHILLSLSHPQNYTTSNWQKKCLTTSEEISKQTTRSTKGNICEAIRNLNLKVYDIGNVSFDLQLLHFHQVLNIIGKFLRHIQLYLWHYTRLFM